MINDEEASDASSDLFEIESFSTQTTFNTTYHRRDSLDKASSFDARRLAANGSFLYTRCSLYKPLTPPSLNDIARTECYESSEARIYWSATTVEGFNRASIANFSVATSDVVDNDSDYARARSMAKKSKRRLSSASPSPSQNGLLSSCRCEKAVSVGPNPVKSMSTTEAQREGPPLSVESTFRHASRRPSIANKPPLAKSPLA